MRMNTKEEQGTSEPYDFSVRLKLKASDGKMRETDRAPLLSDETIIHWSSPKAGKDPGTVKYKQPYTVTVYQLAAKAARDFYEDLITRGELMVVKTVNPVVRSAEYWRYCSGCDHCISDTGDVYNSRVSNFCPGCGAKIIDP